MKAMCSIFEKIPRYWISALSDIANNRFRERWKPVTIRGILNEIGTTTCQKETARNFDKKRYALDFPGIAYRGFLLRFLTLRDRYELRILINMHTN